MNNSSYYNEFYRRQDKKPISDEPSKLLSKYVDFTRIPNKPILDIGCGYGRNGLFFVRHGFKVVFIDYDHKALQDIESSCLDKMQLCRTLNVDLRYHRWKFPDESCGGVLLCHYYHPDVLINALSRICQGGLLYVETIDNRSNNYLGLPEYKEIYSKIKEQYYIRYYKEHRLDHDDLPYPVSTLKLIAYKK